MRLANPPFWRGVGYFFFNFWTKKKEKKSIMTPPLKPILKQRWPLKVEKKPKLASRKSLLLFFGGGGGGVG